jgi:nitronate monooxygenase/enoyl-[acyl-carrier protein] reductase II
MLRTSLCDLFRIDYPIILAPMGSATSAEFAAAASNAGGLGSIGTLNRSTEAILRDIEVVAGLTDRPYAINHIPPVLDERAFRATLEAQPAAISFALGDPGDLVRRAHDAGSLVIVQVTTVVQAVEAAGRGADVIIAQGGEAGGYVGAVSTFPLLPQVVDAVAPIPVVAAGGIFEGRGLAAALVLGAVGVNLGTRFLASTESPISDKWRQAIVQAASEDTMKLEVLNDINPLPGTVGYRTVLRSIRTPFMDEWQGKRETARAERKRLSNEMHAAMSAGRRHEVILTAGQSAGGIKDVLPVAQIIQRMMAEAEAALSAARRESSNGAASTFLARP